MLLVNIVSFHYMKDVDVLLLEELQFCGHTHTSCEIMLQI
jgi:hypothetical protein